jgi:uncharacterized protein YndB with AHSA1/START domain
VIDPLRLSFEIACPAEHAFDTWARRFGTWWPRTHTVSGDPEAIVFEGRIGGRIYERTPAGDEVDWGEVTAWEPPRRIAYLWHIRRPRAQATDVEVTFVPVGDAATRLDIVQGGWERLGDEGPSWREANHRGWEGMLESFAAACEGSTTTREES